MNVRENDKKNDLKSFCWAAGEMWAESGGEVKRVLLSAQSALFIKMTDDDKDKNRHDQEQDDDGDGDDNGGDGDGDDDSLGVNCTRSIKWWW